jgi:glycosyltransferase involved in cell wall biosynthesis
MDIIKNKFLIRILLWLERTIYEQSQAIVTLSPGMADGVRSVLKKEKSIAIIPNSSDIEVFHPDIEGSSVRKERGWGDKLVLLHFGAMGKANGLGFVIDVAERLKSNTNVHFVLIGDGSEKASLIERVNQSSLKNVEIASSVPKTELPGIIAACDISMVIFANYLILEHNSANKFFDSLCAGRPVLLNYSGWQREILEENNAGYGCKLYNVDEFAEKVLYLNSHRASLVGMAKNARQVAVERFDRDKLASSALSLLEEQRYQVAGSLRSK